MDGDASEAEARAAGLLSSVAYQAGSSEPALRLLLSIALGYPLAFVYRRGIHDKSPNVQHVFFATCGIVLCYFNYGFTVYHSLVCVLLVYLLLLFQGGTRLSVWIAYIFFMGYLLIGYYVTQTEGYDIIWTMPHCVLTLRVIGLVVDVHDGTLSEEQKSVGQKEVALANRPSLLEVFGYVYFFGGFMAGPQFPMKRYLKFTSGELIEGQKGLPNSVPAGLIRGATGIGYILCFMIANSYIPPYFLLSSTFKNSSLLMKHLFVGIWGKLVFAKYTICWILAEGSCTVMGITYNGKDDKGRDLWNGCANVHLIRLETATTYGHMIQSFNILTNKWAAHYVYKRLRFMGNKLISQAVTLLFLAVWHGLSFGYYCCFALEFGCTKLEADIGRIIANYPSAVSFLNQPVVRLVKLALMRLYIIVFVGYCLIPFVMLTWSRSHEVLIEIYYTGHILYFGWLLASPFALAYFLKSSKDKQKAQ